MVAYPVPVEDSSSHLPTSEETEIGALSDEDVDRIFHALADATRRDIVRRTLIQESSVSELAARYTMSMAAVQKHLKVLEGVGLITKHPRGRQRLVRGNPESLREAQRLLGHFESLWRDRISRLDHLLGESSPAQPSP